MQFTRGRRIDYPDIVSRNRARQFGPRDYPQLRRRIAAVRAQRIRDRRQAARLLRNAPSFVRNQILSFL